MKSSNVFQTLKARGYSTGDSKPSLPGIGSPLKKSPYKVDPPKEKAKPAPPQAKPELTPKEKKYGKYGYKEQVVEAESSFYDGTKGELIKTFSDADVEKYGIKKTSTTKATIKPPASPATMKSPVKMDSCASEATVGSNPKRAMRQAERRAKKGHRQAKANFRKCKRSRYGRGNG